MLRMVFSPLRINRMEVGNRVLMSSMHLSYEGGGQYERLAHFYRLRAKDGPGIIVTAGCSPNAAGRATQGGFALDSDSLIGQHRLITRAVHEAGDARVALQLLHFGREAFHGRLVAPSALRLSANLYKPTALTGGQVVDTITNYGQAAARAVEAGYDAIELLFSQGFLIHQFLSPHTNCRTDEWGGNLDGRMRFALRVAETVRQAVGNDFPIIYRVPCLDMLSDGLHFEDALTLVERLSQYQIDLLNISIGWHESHVPTLANSVPQAGFSAVAGRIKHRFPHLLTCVSNRINDLRIGEELLLEGSADMVAMARPFLADREIVRKSRQQRYTEVNGCIACNQDCLDNMFLGREVGCSVNPECGEADDGEPSRPLPDGFQVAVIGGGLAGMSAAWYLRRRGARVTLFEHRHALGGQMRLASTIPGKQEFAATIRTFEQRLRSSGVLVELGRRFGEIDVRARSWDFVVLATGTVPNFPPSACEALDVPGLEGIRGVQVIGWRDLLEHHLPVAFPVVIHGGGGVACDIAKYLLTRPHSVDLSEAYLEKYEVDTLVGALGERPKAARPITITQRSSKKIAYRMGRTTRWIAVEELERNGVEMLRSAELVEVCLDGARFHINGKPRLLPARTLVMANGQRPDHYALMQALERAGQPFAVIGAAVANAAEPASISTSIRSGYEFANRQVDEWLAAATVRAEPVSISVNA